MSPEELFALRLNHLGMLTEREGVISQLTRTVGVQSQAQRHAEIGLILRNPDLTRADLAQAYASGKLVRGWAQRWTHQLMTKADWNLVVAARKTERLPAAYFQGQSKLIHDVAKQLERVLQVQPRFSKEAADTVMDAAASELLSNRARYAILQLVVAHGRAYFDPASTMSNYVLLANQDKLLPTEEAIRQLAPRFLAGFGPAREADFCKWLGVSPRRVDPIWQSMSRDWHPVTVGDDTLFELMASSRTERESLVAKTKSAVILTAGFDASETGYVKKDWLTDPEHQAILWSKNGLLQPVIIADGQVVGTWRYQLTTKQCNFTIRYWHPIAKTTRTIIESRLTPVAAFLEREVGSFEYQKI